MSGIGNFMERKRTYPTEAFYGLVRAQFRLWPIDYGP